MSDGYVVNKESRIFIYGAGTLGSIVGKNLIEKEFNICGYVDQRFKEIHVLHGIKCYSEDGLEKIADKEKDVLIIVIKDVFEHENIKHKWYKKGFKKIIYKPLAVINGGGSDSEKDISAAYDLLVGKQIKKSFSVSFAEPQSDISSAWISQEGEMICTYIPTELIYTNRSKSGEYDWGDINIHALVPHLELFHFFSGDKTEGYSDYLLFCEINAKKEHVRVTAAWKRNVLRNRYNVYMQMQQYLAINREFFIKNAPEAEWNDKGYFNLKNGKHRAAFLVAKKLPYIACKISEKDFEKWKVQMAGNGGNQSFPESPTLVGKRNTEFEFWKEILGALFFYICRLNLNETMVPNYRGQIFLDLTENDGYLVRNIIKYGLRVDASDEDIRYVLLDMRSGRLSKETLVYNARVYFLIEDQEIQLKTEMTKIVIWRGMYEGKAVLLSMIEKGDSDRNDTKFKL